MSSRSMLLPSPELDGDFDPQIHLTPTRSTADEATISMKPGNFYPEDDVVMRDGLSNAGGAYYDEDQSSPSPMGRDPPNNFSSPTACDFRMPSLIEATSFASPPSMPPARSFFPSNTQRGRRSSQEATTTLAANSRSLPPFPTTRDLDSILNTNSTRTSLTSNNENAPAKRRRGRHVRSTFVLDGNFTFSNTAAKPSFIERSNTEPFDATTQEPPGGTGDRQLERWRRNASA
mmetsp:Transcript_6049/g.9464  ORF Transcript_6049/g.9464 Transcript_6049/m.9464 type:complete len:232 (+) Transcript_6049:81-776(+)|eukprot:CAMPEP_0178762096 /NCGR_PEP_ID=MMETSP0744-20121128/16357_1 /TAXON_ID=913974 /ORGANISM="Nitzschia punctata, Strain CCMP561" /LENGTH=231 /DNA_ID=CAMNT_0020416745 /DNA_START=69 /DNA_END=764 /DNA_ORIENTATION=-